MPSNTHAPPAKRSFWRRGFELIRNLMALLGVFTTVYVVGLTLIIFWQAERDEAQPVDAIVVLGTAQYNGRPSAVLRARLDHAVSLYTQGVAPVLVTTGGAGRDPRFTEAGVGRAYAISRGVPEEAILSEEDGASSWESLQNVAALLQARGWRRIVLVSDPFHMTRLKLMARGLGLEPSASPTRTSPISRRPVTEMFYVLREVAGVTVFGLTQAAETIL